MTVAGLHSQHLLKEVRALAPLWIAAVLGMIAARGVGFDSGVLGAFVLGAAALGAYSTGHEFTYRTMATLLAQPVDRARVLRAKLLTLAPLIIVMAFVSWVALLGAERNVAQSWPIAIITLTSLLGVGAAPWLAVMCRSTTAGFVFTLAIPAALWIAAQIVRTVTTGFTEPALEYTPGLMIVVVGVVSAVILVTFYGRRTFLQLEVIDGNGTGQLLPGIASGSATRRRSHPAVLLVQKELRLHVLALAVAAIYAAAWMAMRLARLDVQIAGQSFQVIAGLYSAFVAIIVGATASAEERAMGVTASQTLQPYAFWKQWSVKVGVAVAVAIALGPALTSALEAAFPLILDSGSVPFSRFRLPSLWILSSTSFAVPALVVLLSLHVSTLCTGALRALLFTLPYGFMLSWLYGLGLQAALWMETSLWSSNRRPFWREMRNLPTADPTDVTTWLRVGEWTPAVALLGFVAMAFVFGFRNQRSAAPGKPWGQLISIATYSFATGVLVTALPYLVLWYLLTH